MLTSPARALPSIEQLFDNKPLQSNHPMKLSETIGLFDKPVVDEH
jgi:hypothetical protein